MLAHRDIHLAAVTLSGSLRFPLPFSFEYRLHEKLLVLLFITPVICRVAMELLTAGMFIHGREHGLELLIFLGEALLGKSLVW